MREGLAPGRPDRDRRPAEDPRRCAGAGAADRRRRRRQPSAGRRPSRHDRARRGDRMNLSELCIRRPVFASVLSLVVVLVGLMAYSRLPVREYPNIDEPVVSVTTDYRGASPEIIESQVTQPLEEVLSGIEGVDVIVLAEPRGAQPDHASASGIDRDQDSAAADVRDRVGAGAQAACPTRSTSRSSPRSRPTRSRSSIWRFVGPAIADRGHRLRRPLRQGPAAEPARRGRGPDLRRARTPPCGSGSTGCGWPPTA